MIKRSKGFSLLEVLIAVVIVATLAALVIPKIIGQIHKAQEAEAVQNLGAIRSAELFLHNFSGRFIPAVDEMAIQSALGIAVSGNFYQYQIINADDQNFLAIAVPTGPLSSWLEEKAIDKDGWLDSGASSGGASGGSSGGGSSGGGSSGGGSSGGGGGTSGGTGSTGVTYTYYTSTVPGSYVTSYTIKPPENLVLTPNDGWLVFSAAPYADVDSYKIERAVKTNGVLQGWTPLVQTVYAGWEDNVQNGTEYCYRAYTVATLPDGQTAESVASTMVCGTAANNPAFDAKVAGGKTDLNSVAAFANVPPPPEGVASGAAEVTFLDDPDGDPTTNDAIPILFGDIQFNALAYQSPSTGTIVLDLAYENQPDEFIALLLAHETLHAIWDQDWNNYVAAVAAGNPAATPLYGNNPDGTIRSEGSSFYQEYNAFLTMAEVWNSFFPNTAQGDSDKAAFYAGLDETGKSLFNQAELAMSFTMDANRARIPFTDPSIVQTLTSTYSYDLPEY